MSDAFSGLVLVRGKFHGEPSMHLSFNDYLSASGVNKWLAALGASNAPVPRQNVWNALHFFCGHMPGISIQQALSYISAMDLSVRVEAVTLTTGTRLLAFRRKGAGEFGEFYTQRGASIGRLGTDSEDRSAVSFIVRTEVRALKSVAGPANATWNTASLRARESLTFSPRAFVSSDRTQPTAGMGVLAYGGATQFLIPNSHRYLEIEQRG